MQAFDDLSQSKDTAHIRVQVKRTDESDGLFEDTVLPLENQGEDTEIRGFPGLWYGISTSIILS